MVSTAAVSLFSPRPCSAGTGTWSTPVDVPYGSGRPSGLVSRTFPPAPLPSSSGWRGKLTWGYRRIHWAGHHGDRPHPSVSGRPFVADRRLSEARSAGRSPSRGARSWPGLPRLSDQRTSCGFQQLVFGWHEQPGKAPYEDTPSSPVDRSTRSTSKATSRPSAVPERSRSQSQEHFSVMEPEIDGTTIGASFGASSVAVEIPDRPTPSALAATASRRRHSGRGRTVDPRASIHIGQP